MEGRALLCLRDDDSKKETPFPSAARRPCQSVAGRQYMDASVLDFYGGFYGFSVGIFRFQCV